MLEPFFYFKIIIGAIIATQFRNAIIGCWWAGASGLIMVYLSLVLIRATPTEATSWYFRYLMAFGLINLSLSITALVFDILTVRYFTQTIYKCESKERQGVCFCSATEAQFRDLFEGLGTLDCNNNVIKNPSILVVNVCFDFICNWIAVVITVLLLHKVICIAITEAKLTRERRLLDESDTRHQISSPSPPDNSQD